MCSGGGGGGSNNKLGQVSPVCTQTLFVLTSMCLNLKRQGGCDWVGHFSLWFEMAQELPWWWCPRAGAEVPPGWARSSTACGWCGLVLSPSRSAPGPWPFRGLRFHAHATIIHTLSSKCHTTSIFITSWFCPRHAQLQVHGHAGVWRFTCTQQPCANWARKVSK